MAVFIDALAAQNIRPRIFVSKYKYFDTKNNTKTKYKNLGTKKLILFFTSHDNVDKFWIVQLDQLVTQLEFLGLVR